MKAKAKDSKEATRNSKPENTEALKKVKTAKKELEAYFTKHKLDPTKDYSKSPKHGAKINELMAIINVNREKVKDSTPPEKHHKKSEDKKPQAKKAKKLPSDSRKVTKYDYPLVDGKEMTSDEKKKFRIQARKEQDGTKPKAEKKAKETKVKTTKVEEKVTKKTKKVSKEEKPSKDVKKKKGDKKKKKSDD